MVFDDVNRVLRHMLTALDVRYPAGGDHPMEGRRVFDADLKTDEGVIGVYQLLHAARPVLLDLSGRAGLAGVAAGWAGRVDLVAARAEEELWPVPPVGEVPAPAALLIRPDGHVAWAADAGAEPDLAALRAALTTWFGPALAG